jgi:hypothetical protein
MDINPYVSPSSALHPQARAGNDSGEVADSLIASLARTKPWLRVVGVFMWIGVVFTLLAALFMAGSGALGSETFKKSNPAWGGTMMAGLVAFYVVSGLLFIFPARRIWSCGSAIDRLTRSRSLADLQVVLDTQRSFWKFVAIGFLAMAALYAVVIVGVMAAAVMKATVAAP